LQISIRDRVFNSLLFFLEHRDEEVQLKALTGLGTVPLSVNICTVLLMMNVHSLGVTVYTKCDSVTEGYLFPVIDSISTVGEVNFR